MKIDRIEGRIAQFIVSQIISFPNFPGRVGGMPFILMAYISEYHAPSVPYGTGFDPISTLGLASGARRLTSDPLRFPIDRPLHEWQVADLKNIWFQDVLIHHKDTPEVVVDHVL